jgi:hypothetical protein
MKTTLTTLLMSFVSAVVRRLRPGVRAVCVLLSVVVAGVTLVEIDELA